MSQQMNSEFCASCNGFHKGICEKSIPEPKHLAASCAPVADTSQPQEVVEVVTHMTDAACRLAGIPVAAWPSTERERQRKIQLALDALDANHEWHKAHDEYDGYADSELCEKNTRAITELRTPALASPVAAQGQTQPPPAELIEATKRICRCCKGQPNIQTLAVRFPGQTYWQNFGEISDKNRYHHTSWGSLVYCDATEIHDYIEELVAACAPLEGEQK